ncbi:hypothetical protein FAVG1_09636 [Fusarium avenaceum]|nr:hypothetical protein FAVG1_09636 [Fusarium avenaceum]
MSPATDLVKTCLATNNMHGNLLEITDICRNTSLDLTYDQINKAFKCRDKEECERLKLKAKDLKIKPEWLFDSRIMAIKPII